MARGPRGNAAESAETCDVQETVRPEVAKPVADELAVLAEQARRDGNHAHHGAIESVIVELHQLKTKVEAARSALPDSVLVRFAALI